MADVYFSRSGAAMAALKRGIKAFETYQPVPKADPSAWCYAERDEGPGIEYARDFAEGKEWIHHVEITELKVPVLIVNITKDELKEEDIPKLFEVRPITPSLWDRQEPWKGPKTLALATGVASGLLPELKQAAQPISPKTPANQPRAPKGEGAVARVWATADEMPGASRQEVIAACVAKGISAGTASTQFSAWRRSKGG
jgi:hypothetical protein